MNRDLTTNKLQMLIPDVGIVQKHSQSSHSASNL